MVDWDVKMCTATIKFRESHVVNGEVADFVLVAFFFMYRHFLQGLKMRI